jgi:Flp pilus assembly protein TadD
MNNLGLIFLETQRADDALPLLGRAVELKPEVPAFHNNLGMALEHAGRFSEAAAAYQGALDADPGYDKAKRNLARIVAALGAA